MSGSCNLHGEIRNALKILVEKPEGNPIWRPKHIQGHIIKVGLKEVGCKFLILIPTTANTTIIIIIIYKKVAKRIGAIPCMICGM